MRSRAAGAHAWHAGDMKASPPLEKKEAPALAKSFSKTPDSRVGMLDAVDSTQVYLLSEKPICIGIYQDGRFGQLVWTPKKEIGVRARFDAAALSLVTRRPGYSVGSAARIHN